MWWPIKRRVESPDDRNDRLVFEWIRNLEPQYKQFGNLDVYDMAALERLRFSLCVGERTEFTLWNLERTRSAKILLMFSGSRPTGSQLPILSNIVGFDVNLGQSDIETTAYMLTMMGWELSRSSRDDVAAATRFRYPFRLNNAKILDIKSHHSPVAIAAASQNLTVESPSLDLGPIAEAMTEMAKMLKQQGSPPTGTGEPAWLNEAWCIPGISKNEIWRILERPGRMNPDQLEKAIGPNRFMRIISEKTVDMFFKSHADFLALKAKKTDPPVQ